MPRILVQINNLGLGGTQLNAVDLAAATTDFGYESVLVAPRDTLPSHGPSIVDVAASRGVPLEMFDRASSRVRGATTARGVITLSRLATRHKTDIFHAYSTGFTRAGYWGPCLFGRRPLVVTAYEMEVDPLIQQRASLIVGTEYLAQEQAHRPGPTVLISPPVDLDRDNPASVSGMDFRALHGVAPQQPAIVMVSRLDDEMKSFSVEVAVQAVGSMADTDAVLIIVGTGNAVVRLTRLAAAVNAHLGRRAVVLTGALADPRPAYAAADVVIGMGGSAARALAFGKPLVVSGELGQFRIFGPASSAALFRNSFWSNQRPDNARDELLACLNPLLRSVQLREELGDFGRKFACEHFGLRAMAARLADVYQTAAASYGAGAWIRDAATEAGAPLRWFRPGSSPAVRQIARPFQADPVLADTGPGNEGGLT
jgi:glycosyltransferase involved in cell wall biosynthesis